ncbi:MAG: hypothetical protein JJE55_07800 [Flavobacteriaceae bacterium]|nr:hypothetical protein [Flavobacteriaceae bacterium]
MSSTSEVGHNKNVANFSTAYAVLEEMGPLYNPSNSSITLGVLTPIKATLNTQVSRIDAAMAVYRADVADKKNAIKKMDKLATKINNYFKSLDVPDNEKENIASQVRRIRGDAPKKKAPANPEQGDDKSISNSRQSFDNKVANFNTLIAQLEVFSEYAPNEDDLKIATLQAYTAELATLNARAHVSDDALITARAERNKTVYFNTSNVVGLMLKVKAYVRSLGPIARPYYEALMRLKFTRIKQ